MELETKVLKKELVPSPLCRAREKMKSFALFPAFGYIKVDFN